MRHLRTEVIAAEPRRRRGVTPLRIAYFLRHGENLHYFAALKPYLDHFLQQGVHENFLVVQERKVADDGFQEYVGYTHLFTTDCDLDAYDLVITPSFLREHERSDRTRVVQIFHGMSDKPFTYERDFSSDLLCLCVGQRQVDRLLQYAHNRRMRWAMIGYPKFDSPPTLPRLFDNGKPTVIYCPTWRKGYISSIEIFLRHPDVVDQLREAYNLIVKPHPNIFSRNRPFYDQGIVDQLERTPGVTLVRSGDVMPWFAQSDLYIGDISASGYEWLYFDRPAIFLNPQPGRLRPTTDFASMTYLWQCGDVCNDVGTLKAVIDANLRHDYYHAIREAVLAYSVYNPRDNGATRRGIRQIDLVLRSLARS
jgi:CDP-Glycerol:Poly(glycerophosphate) glycerophosphotransferase